MTGKPRAGLYKGPVETSNEEGITCMAQGIDEIKEAWRASYEKLLSDPTGHSKDDEFWIKRLNIFENEDNPLIDLPNEAADEMNRHISWQELSDAIKRLPNNKAAGDDCIVNEVLKLVLQLPPSESNDVMPNQQANPPPSIMYGEQSPFGKILLYLTNQLFLDGVPEIWSTAEIVPIHKDGSHRDLGNYRGISLIPVVVKLVTSIVARRIGKNITLSDYQAGFRTEEECVAQATALHEICIRRRSFGKPTYLAFIDFQKAFDTVAFSCERDTGQMPQLHRIII
jgi:hypothetical protein